MTPFTASHRRIKGGTVYWRLAPSLQVLFDEVDRRYPQHDHRRDGAIGDTAHSRVPSGHNPDSRGVVHAVDVDINGIGDRGLSAIADAIVGDRRLWYVIHDRVIRSRTYGWRPQRYNGSDPHTGHVHVEVKNGLHAGYTLAEIVAAENDRSPWLSQPAPTPTPKPKPAGKDIIVYVGGTPCKAAQKLTPDKWTTLQMSKENTSVLWESMASGGAIEYSLDARIVVDGLPPGARLQIRGRRLDAKTLAWGTGRYPVDYATNPGIRSFQYTEPSGKLGPNTRYRVEVMVSAPNVTVVHTGYTATYRRA